METLKTDRLIDAPFLAWLIERGILSTVVAQRVARVQSETADRLCLVLLKLGLLAESRLAEELAEHGGLPRWDAANFAAEPVRVGDFNESFLRARELVPLRVAEDVIDIAVWDPLDEFAPRALEFALERPVRGVVGTRAEVAHALELLYPLESSAGAEGPPRNEWVEEEELDRLKDLASDAPVIRLVQRLIDQAVAARASDVPLEPAEDGLHVRLRLDGLLPEIENHPKGLAAPVVSRIKV